LSDDLESLTNSTFSKDLIIAFEQKTKGKLRILTVGGSGNSYQADNRYILALSLA